jgi:hypothetical protein
MIRVNIRVDSISRIMQHLQSFVWLNEVFYSIVKNKLLLPESFCAFFSFFLSVSTLIGKTFLFDLDLLANLN